MTSSTNGGKEKRVFMHYKSLRMTRYSDGAAEKSMARTRHVTPNWVWLRLARVHKMSVREIKDIVSKRRGYKTSVDLGDLS